MNNYDDFESEITISGLIKEKIKLHFYLWIKRPTFISVKYFKHITGKECWHKFTRIGKENKVKCAHCDLIENRIFPPEHFNCRCFIEPSIKISR